MKILVCDTLYPDFIRANPINPAASYESNLQALLFQSFGTFDSYSRNLRALGHECVDVLANHEQLQHLWASEHGIRCSNGREVLGAQLAAYKPDVCFFQDLSISGFSCGLKAGQLSCPWPGDDKVKSFDVLFSSFPHYIPRIEALGVRAVYNPLAFDPIVLDRVGTSVFLSAKDTDRDEVESRPQHERIYDCVFVGGVGNPSHWKRGMETLEAVAREIPTFKWWGYGYDTLPSDSALRDKYMGTAWGLEMYRVFLQSKIVLNRHGEVAQGYANNMRMFEATGCGAMLLTEDASNMRDFFEGDEIDVYFSPEDAVTLIKEYLDDPMDTALTGKLGQIRTLRDHTYAQRMKTVSDTLQEILCLAR